MQTGKRRMRKGEKIGFGAYGIVHSATSPNGTEIAVKRNLVPTKLSFYGNPRELDMLIVNVRNRHFLRLKEIFLSNPFDSALSPLQGELRRNQRDDKVHFAFDRGLYDLKKVIFGLTTGAEYYKYMCTYMHQMALGIYFMHHQGIVHRDISPGNFIIFDGAIKVCDVGLAKPFCKQCPNTECVTTGNYRAPEMTAGGMFYTPNVDVFSLGMVFQEMISRRQAINVAQDDAMEIMIQTLQIIPAPIDARQFREIVLAPGYIKGLTHRHHVPRTVRTVRDQMALSAAGIRAFEESGYNYVDFCDLLTMMLEFDYRKRCTFHQVLEHKFFEPVRAEIVRGMQVKIDPPTVHVIHDCMERYFVAGVVIEIMNMPKKPAWFTARMAFQAISMTDRYLNHMFTKSKISPNSLESESRGVLMSKHETILKFYCLLYCTYKYFRTVQEALSFGEFVRSINPAFPVTPADMKMLEEFECGVIFLAFNMRIYVPTMYEAADKHNRLLTTDLDVPLMLDMYLKNPLCNGKTAEEMYQLYVNGGVEV